MSALDDTINDLISFYDGRCHYGRQARDARAELAQLRARVEQAESERDEARAQLEIADRLATLAPRRCGTCAQEAALTMREKCALECDRVGSESGNLSGRFLGCREASAAIRALPLPSCDGCNPLKPEAAHGQ